MGEVYIMLGLDPTSFCLIVEKEDEYIPNPIVQTIFEVVLVEDVIPEQLVAF